MCSGGGRQIDEINSLGSPTQFLLDDRPAAPRQRVGHYQRPCGHSPASILTICSRILARRRMPDRRGVSRAFESVSNQAGTTQRRDVGLNIGPASVVPANSYADHTFEYLDDGGA